MIEVIAHTIHAIWQHWISILLASGTIQSDGSLRLSPELTDNLILQARMDLSQLNDYQREMYRAQAALIACSLGAILTGDFSSIGVNYVGSTNQSCTSDINRGRATSSNGQWRTPDQSPRSDRELQSK